jgi:hypothetical protein
MKKSINISGIGRSILLIVIMTGLLKVSVAQNSTEDKESYGISYSYESSRMLNDRMFIKGNYILGRRSFEAGISLDSYTPGKQGFLFQHKIFLNKKMNEHAEFNIKDYNIRTFAVYKFIMFGSSTKSLRNSPAKMPSNDANANPITQPTINTIEHYLGFGVEFKLYKKLFIELMGVGGINIIKNNSHAVIIDNSLLPKSDAGLSWDVTLSMNYNF